jgi:hypothetical protein
LKELAKALGPLDKKLLPHHDITFEHQQKELKKSIEGYTLTTLAKPGFDVNVTTYCLGEVRVQISGEYVALGIPPYNNSKA